MEIVRELGLESEDVVPEALRRVLRLNLQATMTINRKSTQAEWTLPSHL